MENSLHSMVT